MIAEKLFFDSKDYELLEMIKSIESGNSTHDHIHEILDVNFHPHGIKGLIYAPEFRIAHAVIHILTSKNMDHTTHRLTALNLLYSETLASAHSSLRINTARALVQLMKDLVARNTENERLKLAHEFRRTATGTPRLVRRMLMRYHLLEMPESWNQLVFDDHVHDAHSSGKKTPTRLILDAWIKGIRHITIVYCDHIRRQAVEEVLQAAEIVGITARVAVQFGSEFRGKKIRLLWMPRGFADYRAFLDFLDQPDVNALMAQGKALADWKGERTLRQLDAWNHSYRLELAEALDLEILPVPRAVVQRHVGEGQITLAHIKDCLQAHVLSTLQLQATRLQGRKDASSRRELQRLDALNYREALATSLTQSLAVIPAEINPPRLHSISPATLVRSLARLHADSRIVLGLADLAQEDVLELLWDCRGRITHLELFNARYWHEGRLQHLGDISSLRTALNRGDTLKVRQMVLDMVQRMQSEAQSGRRTAKLRYILGNLPLLCDHYRRISLKCHMGSASASREAPIRMGLAFPATLPLRARKAIQRQAVNTMPVPIKTALEERRIRILGAQKTANGSCGSRQHNWSVHVETARVSAAGNMISLTGPQAPPRSNGLLRATTGSRFPGFAYLNTAASNALKVMAGFIPAALTFWYTQQWWFLAWFGAWIWFAVTGVRNAIQMVISGNGGSRRSLLGWRDHVDVGRLCDSLLYTGVSVLILEAGVRIGLLEKGFGVSVQDHPLLVFAVLNIVNGLYISAHNLYRGFPRAAIVGNLFRSVLAIPVSGFFNATAVQLLALAGVADPLSYIIPCAAIISKTASDTVAAIIEGYADSRNNLRMRHWDYTEKLDSLRAGNALFELAHQLDKPAADTHKKDDDGEWRQPTQRTLFIHALDLMYFWFYLPRAQEVFARLLRGMSRTERNAIARLQLVLCKRHDISRMLIEGSLVGNNYRNVLLFYINHRQTYLRDLLHLVNSQK